MHGSGVQTDFQQRALLHHTRFICLFFFRSTIVSQAERIYQCMFNLIQQSKKITRNSLNALLQMTLTRHIRLALTLW